LFLRKCFFHPRKSMASALHYLGQHHQFYSTNIDKWKWLLCCRPDQQGAFDDVACAHPSGSWNHTSPHFGHCREFWPLYARILEPKDNVHPTPSRWHYRSSSELPLEFHREGLGYTEPKSW
jgi:hypothetical protein